jgi:hypothetical protein
VHNTTVGGDVNEAGGGGGHTCTPSGGFAAFGSPVYRDYEDSSMGGSLNVRRYTSCWLGVIRDRVQGSVHLIGDQLDEPNAIEILANHIRNNLECRRNSMVWNSADLTENLYPRQFEPNDVGGPRIGQCVLASPRDPGKPLGPGPFRSAGRPPTPGVGGRPARRFPFDADSVN